MGKGLLFNNVDVVADLSRCFGLRNVETEKSVEKKLKKEKQHIALLIFS